MDERYLEKRKAIERYFVPENRVADSGEIAVSPSGQYELEIWGYSSGPNTWSYSQGIVRRISDHTVIADVKRNYGHFWYAWVEHANGNEYLLCGEDYQGYSIVNLTKETYHVFFPESGHKGFDFCWTAAYPSPDSFVLAVDGCYWACPYELVLYDFRSPEELPYQELARVEGLAECVGWLDNETFVLKREVEFRKSDGVPYDDLAEAEQEMLDNDQSLVGYRSETVHCKRPKFKGDA
jgi:hypothetical protein